MPEFIPVPMHQCEKLEWISVQVGEYTVSRLRDYMFNHCTCKGFMFRKNCKHLKKAQEMVCTYHEMIDGKPEIDGICPKCGGKTVIRNVGV